VRRLAPRPLSAALDRVSVGLAPASTLARVQAAWSDVAGPAIGGEAEPVSERAGTVTFDCRSAVWAQELDLMSEDLRERLNEALGGPSVKALRFVAGGLRRPG
jgi:predicted nucleic acid-binding Zn ribbon protein